MRGKRLLHLVPLFLISAAAIGFEIALTRYFAIANWSEYGYWVISIAMVGFSVSGVLLSLFNGFFAKHTPTLLRWIPVNLMVFAALGYYGVTVNGFNPLELQNPLLWTKQLFNIAKYYAALFPFFFATGLYIGICFVAFQKEIPTVYAVDLAGAGLGAVLTLGLMFWIHPFHLVPILLVVLAVGAAWALIHHHRSYVLGVLSVAVTLALCEFFLIRFQQADYNEYKGIYAPLHVEGNHTRTTYKSPRGIFQILDNFTERLDIDVSNNMGLLQVSVPPATFGLYKDGQRIASIPRDEDVDFSYEKAALDMGVYQLYERPKILLVGSRGGFRIPEVLAARPSAIVALEPDSLLYKLIKENALDRFSLSVKMPSLRLLNESPAAYAAQATDHFDVIDIAPDFLDQSYANRFSFTIEALQEDFQLLEDDGVVSIPVSIREFTVYAVKVILTVKRALEDLGVAAPENHLIVYRSAWNVRVLVFKSPVKPSQVKILKAFCDERSFDMSYYPGIKPEAADVWNDLPMVSFNSDQVVSSDKPTDALMELAVELFGQQKSDFLANIFFNLNPMTYDRPFFYSILKLTKLHKILEKISLIPREEIGYLINVAVLAQSILLAGLVLFLPLFRWRRHLPSKESIQNAIVYFASLGLGFLFLEIYLIEKASFFLNDNTTAFAVILAAMLVFSGWGSYLSGKYLANPRKAVQRASAVILVWIVLAYLFLDYFLFAALGFSLPAKCCVLLLIVAPLSIALGFPFPLGLYLFREEHSDILPWAWSMNGAFSVVATPLANLLAVSVGYSAALWSVALLYTFVAICYPTARGHTKVD